MQLRASTFTAAMPAVVLCGAMLATSAFAQYPRPLGYPTYDAWENQRLRITRISAGPGEAIRGSDADRIFIYLTAAPDGRMAPAEAVWEAGGSGDLEIRSQRRVEAIVIELKEPALPRATGTPPEALAVSRRADVRPLIDNPRVLVTRNRYKPTTFVDPLHFHPEDIVLVYLRGGHTWRLSDWGSYPVRRGDIDIVPAHTLHTFGNPGGDPLEVLVIVPR